jgi:hypothetical protein
VAHVISLNPIKTAIAPYALGIKIALVLALLFGAGYVGWHEKGLRDNAVIAKKNTALTIAAAQLHGAATALNAVNVEAQREIAAAKANAKAAAAAEVIAHDAAKAMAAQVAGFDRKFAAARKQPKCAAVLDLVVPPECGL